MGTALKIAWSAMCSPENIPTFSFIMVGHQRTHFLTLSFPTRRNRQSLRLHCGASTNSRGGQNEPKEFHLFQNCPNPFNQTTGINYQLPMHNSQLTVTLKIFNVLGEEVRILVSGEQKAGRYGVVWDGQDNKGRQVSSGIYFCQLKAGDFVETKKLVLLR
ncbi:MAG: FlgD immunoglobulin-like domain containing protein [bacterium]